MKRADADDPAVFNIHSAGTAAALGPAQGQGFNDCGFDCGRRIIHDLLSDDKGNDDRDQAGDQNGQEEEVITGPVVA